MPILIKRVIFTNYGGFCIFFTLLGVGFMIESDDEGTAFDRWTSYGKQREVFYLTGLNYENDNPV